MKFQGSLQIADFANTSTEISIKLRTTQGERFLPKLLRLVIKERFFVGNEYEENQSIVLKYNTNCQNCNGIGHIINKICKILFHFASGDTPTRDQKGPTYILVFWSLKGKFLNLCYCLFWNPKMMFWGVVGVKDIISS